MELGLELINLLMTIVAWTALVMGIIFLAFKSGDIYDTIKDMVRTWKER